MIPSVVSEDENPWWNEEWKYRKEIEIPIDVNLEKSKFQPIDIHFDFDDVCWARNKDEHSIRVISQYGGRFHELECQIYDLNFTDDEFISGCNLVFLVPENVEEKDNFYVYYDDEETSKPGYVDHIKIKESDYNYQPFASISFKSSFYKITDDDDIVYGVAYGGETLDTSICQQVTKFKAETTNILPNSGEHLASFNFIYWWQEDNKWHSISSSENLITNQILVNGNLMTKFAIVSESDNGMLRTTGYYKYYHCPIEDKRIFVNIRHEVVKYPLPVGSDIDVGIAMINTGGIHSSVIDELNFGKIPPYLHVFGENGLVLPFDVDQNPEGVEWQEIIGKKDDVDLGSYAWFSSDYGETGEAHGIIFDDNKILKSGDNERDGIELQLFEANNIKYPGLDGISADFYVMRNQYEPGEEIDINLPSNYVVEYNACFYSTKNGGYKAIENEAIMFQTLVEYQPENHEELVEEVDHEKYNMTVNVYLPPYLLLRYISSLFMLKNTYISAELHYDNEQVAYGRVGRIPLKNNFFIDWKNITLFRKVIFDNLRNGTYLIKIFLENAVFGDEKQFIGFRVVNVNSDLKTSIICNPEGILDVTLVDQEWTKVEGAQLVLSKFENDIFKAVTDSNGLARLYAPCGYGFNYLLIVYYKGFLVKYDQIQMGREREFKPLTKLLHVHLHNLSVKIKDSSDGFPNFDVDLSLTSKDMSKPVVLREDTISYGSFIFENLVEANYTLKIKYDQFEIEEEIVIDKSKEISIDLSDITIFIEDKWGFSPDASINVYLTSNQFSKTVFAYAEKISDNAYKFSNLYPGDYTLKIAYKNHLIQEDIKIPYSTDDNLTVLFPILFNATVEILDSHGNPLQNAKISIKRTDGSGITEQADIKTNENGIGILTIPPGNYIIQVHKDKKLIAERHLEILNNKKISIATIEDPFLNSLIIFSSIILLLMAIIVSYKKRDAFLFLRLLVIILIIISIFSPWWMIQGENADKDVNTTTKLYIYPIEMITLSSQDHIITGESTVLPDEYLNAVNWIPIMLISAVVLLGLCLVLIKMQKNKLSILCMIACLILLLTSICIFYIAMTEFSNITVGGFSGSGDLDVKIPGESSYITVESLWGPFTGFYLLVISSIIIFVNTVYVFRKKIYKKSNSC